MIVFNRCLKALFCASASIILLATSNAIAQAGGGGHFPEIKGSYLGQSPPGQKPTLFAPGIISTDLHDDFSPAFTPDGDEVFFRCIGNGKMIILHMAQRSGVWTHPEIATFSGKYNDMGVFLSHDGRRLFFSSNRPVSDDDTDDSQDIFVVDRIDGGWGEPHSLIHDKNWSWDIFGCSVDAEGTIYYHAKHPKGMGGYDICRLVHTGSNIWQEAPLTIPVNTSGDETCPCIANDGSFLIYSAGKGPTQSEGGCGLYITFLQSDDTWTLPRNLSACLGMNLPGKFAGLSPDGKYLFFVVPESTESNRRLGRLWNIEELQGARPRYGGGNVYWVDTKVLDEATSR